MHKETFESLWDYCTSDNRVIPNPMAWNALYEILKDKRRTPSGGWEPPLPLILGAWNYSMPIEKQLRFKEHILWADSKDQLSEAATFLRSLPEEQWYHFGEL